MRTTFLLLFLLMLMFCNSYAQDNSNADPLQTQFKADAGSQGIGLTLEPRMGRKLTTEFSVGAGGGFDIAEDYIYYDFVRPAMYFSASPKFFYNRAQRAAKGKSIASNSGNYFGARIKYSMPFNRTNDAIRNSLLVNVHWGIQRPLGTHFIFNAFAGALYARDLDYRFGSLFPAIDFKFSYLIK